VKHPLRFVAIGVAVVVVAFSVVLATQVGGDPRSDATTSRLLGDAVPEFSVQTLDGTTVTETSVAGRVVIVNFWNTWCIPCHEELPALREFYEAHADDPDFVMIGIVRDDEKSAVRSYVGGEDMGWTIALDPGAAASLGFGTRGQPETFAISAEGVIVGSKIGPASVRDLEVMLRAARGTAAA
jgi:cytochrome c biogenesis protein CcmG/thiol:disulfide interchange protein DsbE